MPNIGKVVAHFWKVLALDLGFNQLEINVINGGHKSDMDKAMEFLTRPLLDSIITPEEFVDCQAMKDYAPLLRDSLINAYKLNSVLSSQLKSMTTPPPKISMDSVLPRDCTLKNNQRITVCRKLPDGRVVDISVTLEDGIFSINNGNNTTVYTATISPLE